jgi:hypothetical protein
MTVAPSPSEPTSRIALSATDGPTASRHALTTRSIASPSPARCARQGTTTSTSPAPSRTAAAASAAALAGSSSPAGKLATAAIRTPVPASGATARPSHSG